MKLADQGSAPVIRQLAYFLFIQCVRSIQYICDDGEDDEFVRSVMKYELRTGIAIDATFQTQGRRRQKRPERLC
jgi:hypothetical protein